MDIKHILLTTDLSDHARLGYPHAKFLADRLGARVTLFHVREQVYPNALSTSELAGYDYALGETFSRRIVREKDACAQMGLDVEVRSGLGTPSKEILSYAESQDVDLVILTSHGSRGPRSLLFGSTAKRVVRHAAVPFLLIPADAAAVRAGFHPYRRVITTTDFSDDSARGLDVALGLCECLDADLTLVHIVVHPAAASGVGGESPGLDPRRSGEWPRASQTATLQQMVSDKGANRLDYWLSREPSAPEGIVLAARRLRADLIVVPSHGKGAVRAVLFGSNSEHVLNLSPVPVLVLPRSYLARRSG